MLSCVGVVAPDRSALEFLLEQFALKQGELALIAGGVDGGPANTTPEIYFGQVGDLVFVNHQIEVAVRKVPPCHYAVAEFKL